jgi:hypothetical protein
MYPAWHGQSEISKRRYVPTPTQIFYVALAALSLAGSIAMPWLSVKHKKNASAPAADESEREDSIPPKSKTET